MILPILAKQQIHRDNLIWLLIAQAFSILPLLFYLPIWLVFFWISAILWRIQIYRERWVFPNIFVKMLLCMLCIAAIYFSFHGVNSVEPMISFLVCAFVLKTVELHSKKDALIVMFISFIAIASQFLFAQDILAGAYGIFALFVVLSAWQAAFFSKGLNIKMCLRRGGTLVVQSLPFMVVLFVIMPRLGPLWSVPMPHHQGKTGFGETLRMGDIGNLVRSQGVAFRVGFSDTPPNTNQLYWRGVVLDHFDGFQWRAQQDLPRVELKSPSQINAGEGTFQYSIILEPHGYRWLFSLDQPVAASSSQLNVYTNADNTLLSSELIVRKSQYAVVSSVNNAQNENAASSALTQEQWARFTSLPIQGNDRAKNLARTWRRDLKRPEDIVTAALDLYQKDFSYTLQPTVLNSNVVDQFLFESKNGFCEHFASSFVFLMRSAGIPSRVVMGYQGGSYNRVDDYFVVNQADAHAWAEVWLNNRWQMIDPTSAVAPSRVNLGFEESLSDSDLSYIEHSLWRSGVLLGLYQRWDAMGYAWNRWVLNYDQDNQEGLFKKLLGSTSPWRVGMTFVGLSAFIFLGYALLPYLLKRRKQISPENKLIRPLLRKLERKGYVRASSESIAEFSERLLKENPPLGRRFQPVAKAYTLAVYAGGEKDLALLAQITRTHR